MHKQLSDTRQVACCCGTINGHHGAIVTAKFVIVSGLLALFASVALFGLEDNIHDLIQERSEDNQKSFKLSNITEHEYLTNLKQFLLQKLCKSIQPERILAHSTFSRIY